MAKRGPKSAGKQEFIQEFLEKNPEANEVRIKEAWQTSGHDGTVSGSMIYKVKAKLGLARLPRGPKKEETSSHSTPRAAESRPRAERRGGGIEEIEAALDRAIYKTMEHGNLPEVESALRRARRVLIQKS